MSLTMDANLPGKEEGKYGNGGGGGGECKAPDWTMPGR